MRVVTMFDLIITQVVGGAMILAIGVGVFFAVNTKRPVVVEGIDDSGVRREVIRWQRGTRRSRWRGYCVIGGVFLGFHAACVYATFSGANKEGCVVRQPVESHGLAGMAGGLLAGLALGAISSRFLPERTRPPDPDTL